MPAPEPQGGGRPLGRPPPRPFRPRVVDGRIYGRGACDSKGSIAALITALAIIQRERRELVYDLTVSFTPDEEVGVYSGVAYMVDETRSGRPFIEGDFFLSIDGHQNHVSIGKTGLIKFRVEIEGRSAHIARAWTGMNAIHLAAPVLDALLQLKARVEERVSRYRGNPDLPLGHVRPNLCVTRIEGGSVAEAVPDRCVLHGVRTVLPDESPDPMADARNELITAILRVKHQYQMALRFQVDAVVPPFITSDEMPAVRRLVEVASRGRHVVPAACSEGYNDVAVVSQLGIPIVARGLQGPDCNVHMPDENLPLENLKRGIEDLVAFLSE